MFKCPKCQMNFFTLRDLLCHFYFSKECLGHAICEALLAGAHGEIIIMLMDAGTGEVDKWLDNPQGA